MLRTSLFIFLLSFSIQIIGSRKATVDIYTKSIKVAFDHDYLKIDHCGIKTSRQYRTGLINCPIYLTKQLDEAYLQLKLFYKYGTIYRDYLFDYKRIDYCELMKKKRIVRYSNPLADIARLTITKCLPQMDHECPFLPQFYNNSAIDINGTLPSLLPPVVPAGECHETQNHIRI